MKDRKMSVNTSRWEPTNGVVISHNVMDYEAHTKTEAHSDLDLVRLHFGLRGSYSFHYKQLGRSYELSGHHNNIMYTNGFDIEVENETTHLETFGINMNRDVFVSIGEKGNKPLKRFTEDVVNRRNVILDEGWRTNTFQMQQVIDDIIHCPYTDQLQDIYLYAKTLELLVLQAELYEDQHTEPGFTETDKRKLIEAREVLHLRVDQPPTIAELSRLIGLNEYKLKSGFRQLFGTTIFGFINGLRLDSAKRLLLDTDKTAKEIAYQTGYSSPQHFSRAFKKQFGISPDRMRKNPN